MSTLGERLRKLRGPSSQAEMAASVGVKQQNWARWEGDVVTPSLDMIVKILREHPCSTDWLLGLPSRGGSATARGDGAIAAAGSNIHIEVGKPPVKTSTPGEMAACRKCPCKRLYDAVQKAQKSLPK